MPPTLSAEYICSFSTAQHSTRNLEIEIKQLIEYRIIFVEANHSTHKVQTLTPLASSSIAFTQPECPSSSTHCPVARAHTRSTPSYAPVMAETGADFGGYSRAE